MDWEVDEPSDLDMWLALHKITDLRSILLSNGFLTLDVVLEIDGQDLDAMKITLPGDRKRILVAIARSKAPQQPSISPPPPHRPPPSSESPPLPGTKQRSLRRCKKNCHQIIIPGERHKCGEENKCESFESCHHLPFHPEEKKRQRSEMVAERKRKRSQEKEEVNEAKKRRDDLLRVHRQKKFDGWWRPALERMVASDPDRFGLEEGSKKRALAMIEVTRSWAECRRRIRLQGEINKKIKHELKAKVFTRDEELAYIKQRQAELGAAHDLEIDPLMVEIGDVEVGSDGEDEEEVSD
jgi:hypothetical protein